MFVIFAAGLACQKLVIVSHMRSHAGKQSQADYAEILPQQPTEAGLKSHHTRVHKDKVNINNKDKSFVCHICNKACKSDAGLLSHEPEPELMVTRYKLEEMAFFCKEVAIAICIYVYVYICIMYNVYL